jgi:hypothetical protein
MSAVAFIAQHLHKVDCSKQLRNLIWRDEPFTILDIDARIALPGRFEHMMRTVRSRLTKICPAHPIGITKSHVAKVAAQFLEQFFYRSHASSE